MAKCLEIYYILFPFQEVPRAGPRRFFLEYNFLGIKDEIIEQNFQEFQMGSLV